VSAQLAWLEERWERYEKVGKKQVKPSLPFVEYLALQYSGRTKVVRRNEEWNCGGETSVASLGHDDCFSSLAIVDNVH
jgi:hypothetical protein